MTHYSIVAMFSFDQPMKVAGVADAIDACARTFWINADSFAQAVDLAQAEARDGETLTALECVILTESDLGKIDLPPGTDANARGVFYRSEPSLLGPQGSAPRWWQIWR